ncbi:MAG TPA: HEAT repeat domain-containing protein [Burkholderiaceae bacterium]
MFSTSDPILLVAFWTGAGALLLTCLIGLQTILLRMALLRRQKREHAFLARWRPALMAYLVDTEAGLPAKLARGDRLYFLKLWNHLQESLRGEASQTLNAAARQLGCDVLARDMLHRGNRAQRLLAILTLGHLRDAKAWDMLRVQASMADSIVSVNALRALTQIDAGRAARELTPQLLARDDWPLARLASLLLETQDSFAAELLAAIPGADDASRVRVLRLIEALHLMLPDALVDTLFTAGQPVELTIAALRISPTPALLAHARGLSAHPDWRVRLQTAKVLGAAGNRGDVILLRTLLSDAEWWVRYRAAHALTAMPFLGQPELAALQLELSDRYGAEMLAHVLAEKAQA